MSDMPNLEHWNTLNNICTGFGFNASQRKLKSVCRFWDSVIGLFQFCFIFCFSIWPCLHMVLRFFILVNSDHNQTRQTPSHSHLFFFLIHLFCPLSATFQMTLKGGSMVGCKNGLFLIYQPKTVKKLAHFTYKHKMKNNVESNSFPFCSDSC